MIKKLKTKDILEFMLIHSYFQVQYFQKLIDEWNDPKDIAQRAAVLLRDTNKWYGRLLYVIYRDMMKR